MATLVFCEFDIMIIIGFMIDDDFAAWDRCDNWVGSLFGGSRQGGWDLQTLPFSPSIDHCSFATWFATSFNKTPFSASQSFSTHSEIPGVTKDNCFPHFGAFVVVVLVGTKMLAFDYLINIRSLSLLIGFLDQQSNGCLRFFRQSGILGREMAVNWMIGRSTLFGGCLLGWLGGAITLFEEGHVYD